MWIGGLFNTHCSLARKRVEHDDQLRLHRVLPVARAVLARDGGHAEMQDSREIQRGEAREPRDGETGDLVGEHRGQQTRDDR